MASKVKVEKFERINKATAKIPAGHTRTCTSKGKCYHGTKSK